MKVSISIRVRVPGGFQYGRYQSSNVPGCVHVYVCVRVRGREGELGVLQLRVGESAVIGLPHR